MPEFGKAAVYFLLFVLNPILLVYFVIDIGRNPCDYYADKKGCLEFHRAKTLYEGVTLDAQVSYVSSRSGNIRWLRQDEGRVELIADSPASAGLEQAPAITILVHGFRGVDAVVATYFKELTSQLVHYPRYSGKVIVYDWASTARDFFALSPYERARFAKRVDGVLPDTLNFMPTYSFYYDNSRSNYATYTYQPPPQPSYTDYQYFDGYRTRQNVMKYFLFWESFEYNRDQNEAEDVGAAHLASLVEYIHRINSSAYINLVGHSMGCYVIQQALVKNPDIRALLHKIVWLAPDVEYGIFDDADFVKAIAQIESLEVFYSRNDGALKWPSRLANRGKRLGASGAKNVVPANVTIHDLTGRLVRLDRPTSQNASQSDEDVDTILGDVATHTAFLIQRTGVPEMVAKILSEGLNDHTDKSEQSAEK